MALPASDAAATARAGVRTRRRWWVHLTLIGTAAVSLAAEPVLTLHIAGPAAHVRGALSDPG